MKFSSNLFCVSKMSIKVCRSLVNFLFVVCFLILAVATQWPWSQSLSKSNMVPVEDTKAAMRKIRSIQENEGAAQKQNEPDIAQKQNQANGGNQNPLHSLNASIMETTTTTTTTTTTDPYKLDGSELNYLDQLPYPKLVDGARFLPNRKVVHFDLKGAPPKVKYFQELFPLLKKLGTTSILMEYEDMFPFTGALQEARNLKGYSESEVKTILDAAKNENIEVIPLVQTFGHLEWLLKLKEFAHLRENSQIPQVICFGLPEAWNLMQEILDQVVNMHKPYGLPFLHIGADEAFQIGMCQADNVLMRQHQGNKQKLILWQISRTAKYLRQKHKTRVLAWHDMFSSANAADLQKSEMTELVEPVVWDYQEHLNLNNVFSKLKVFPYIWAGSSFKGADGPSQYFSNPPHYMANHYSWLETMSSTRSNFKQFRGVILTGWSRFDHMAVLCEFLPVGFPSLAFNLMILNGARDNFSSLEPLLGCKMEPHLTAPNCIFPGSKIYYSVQELRHLKQQANAKIFRRSTFKGWMSRTNIKFQFSSGYYVTDMLRKANQLIERFEILKDRLRIEMEEYFYTDAINEFVYQYVDDDLESLINVQKQAEKILDKNDFPRRPFPELLDDEPMAPKLENAAANVPKQD